MAIKVLRYKVMFNGKEYLPNEIIDGLSDDEEVRLLSMGIVEKILVAYRDSKTDQTNTKNNSQSEDTSLNFDPDEYIESGNKDKKVRK
jgi:hypothetical protein